MDVEQEFANLVARNIEEIARDKDFLGLSNIWIRESIRKRYAQNFTWLGRPIIQVPQDIYALQEIIWKVNPDLIIETGVAHGGSLIMSASMLALLDYCSASESGVSLNPKATKRKVVGIDIDIRPHNRKAIESHPLSHFIQLIEGSSIDDSVVSQVKQIAKNGYQTILVCLDSNHTHDHVLAELNAYAPLVSPGSYCIVWDTGVEDLPAGFCSDRPWDKGNNPKTAVWEFLKPENKTGESFSIDKVIENKITITASPEGFLKRSS